MMLLKFSSKLVKLVDKLSKKTQHLLSSLLLTKDHFPSVLKLIQVYSKDIPAEFLILALVELHLTIVLQLLDMTTLHLHHTSLSKTHGVLLGEMKVISTLPLKLVDLKVFVVSMKNHIMLNIADDLINNSLILFDLFR